MGLVVALGVRTVTAPACLQVCKSFQAVRSERGFLLQLSFLEVWPENKNGNGFNSSFPQGDVLCLTGKDAENVQYERQADPSEQKLSSLTITSKPSDFC